MDGSETGGGGGGGGERRVDKLTCPSLLLKPRPPQ